MLRIDQLKLPVGHTWDELEQRVKKILHCQEIENITIVRRSIDARKKPELYFNYILNIQVRNQKEIYHRCDKKRVSLCEEKAYRFPVKDYEGQERPVVIGMGPAGLFCGYMLAKAGFRPLLLERGVCVEDRIRDVETFWETGKLNPESNVQFGEGGAGAFSDGKLNTLVKDKYGRNRLVLELLVEAGAPKEILYDHKPHIGTDILCNVVANLRRSILEMGGEVRFRAKVTGIEQEKGHLSALIVNEKERLPVRYAVLAPGHSARDLFYMLKDKGIRLEAKSFAVGMRIEHPQAMINLAQYGREEEPVLGNAPYKVTARSSDGRGVYSFCMCPGGYVVNASSEPGALAVNGMSYSGRDGANANSAIIISVTPQDFGGEGPLAGVEFQRALERKAFELRKGSVPVERYGDFKAAVDKERIPIQVQAENGKTVQEIQVPDDFLPCIKGQWEFGPVHTILPKQLNSAFVEGMEQFGKIIPGFDHPNVLVDGLESRTSSPVRILRDEKTLESSLPGLYPCGEGAGYAGGITSAAMDGVRVAEAVALHIIHDFT